MTNYQELKRLAEAAKLELADIANVVIEDGDLSHHELFQSLASPDVVLGLIKSLEHTTMAAEAEAKEVDERNAVIDRLRTQNQALMEALERMVESVTGVDQVSAVDEARAALTAAKQAQPEPVNQVLLKALSAMLTHSGMDEDEWSKPTFDQARAAIMLATTKTQECGMCGYVGTKTDAVGQCPRCHWDELQAQTSQADAQDAARYRWLRSTTNWASNSSNERIDVRNSPELWDAAIDAAINAKERAAHGIKQGGQHD